ncbi:uncharacterized protein C8A04DRAFT_27075 [Dichotomopilus funicola]|uniref:Uncharacterized protein n=1 Tax=Dichotomopilus funicola TaxID=1934379 RepID=A0AAN6V566_9PEZI|nr:hypothetical protein C8A04DRAFT_27075 [Dichotomopilus funicola]
MTQPSPAGESPLLRLSPRIRLRIYRKLGLGPWGNLVHRFYLHAGQLQLRRGRGVGEYWRWVPDPTDFHGLLLSCRAIYAEAAALLYSTSQFFIYYAEPLSEADRLECGQPEKPMLGHRPLQVLHNLTNPSLAHLSYLKVVLN